MRNQHHALAVFKTLFTVVVALFVAVRVVAQPLLLSSAEPGMMAICTGGQVVYVSMDTGKPVAPDGKAGPAADPCPFFGVTSVDHIAKTHTPMFEPRLRDLVATSADRSAPKAWHKNQNTARAPPERG